jgi:hypothetical protein
MLNEEQMKRINDEMNRLNNRGIEISLSTSYSKESSEEIQSYIHGKIDAFKWVKENI